MRRLGLVESLLGAGLLVVAVATRAAVHLVHALGLPWPLAVVGVVSAVVVAGTLVGLPFGAARLAHERRWGFSRQGNGAWVLDHAKELAISLILSNAAALGFFAIARATAAWWVVAWVGAVVVSVILAAVAPAVLAPMFNAFRPLEDPRLNEEVAALGRKAGVRIRQVLVMDASRRTAKHNAYFTGLGRTKRVVLWDTLLADYQPEATLVVLAHELGHWRRRHQLRMLALTAVMLLGAFAVLDLLASSPSVASWSGTRGAGDPAVVPLLLLAASAMQLVWLPVALWWSRAWERQADLDALAWSGDPAAFVGLQHDLALKNLSDLAPSRLSYLLASHPPAAERMALAAAIPAPTRP